MINALTCIGCAENHLVKIPQSDLCADGEAAAALSLLAQAAKAAGFSLDVASAYRSFSRQCAIFDAKWHGTKPVLDAAEKPMNISGLSAAEKVAAICRFSAIPGFSRHHFGTDFDIYSKSLLPPGEKLRLTAYEYAEGAYFYPLGKWLSQNLGRFGFVRPYSGKNMGYEPWHISYASRAALFLNAFSFDAAAEALHHTDYPWADPCIAYAKKHYRTLLGMR